MVMLKSNLFNEKVKVKFLEGYGDLGTRTDFQRVLVKCQDAERTIGKDLYDFNLLEIESILYSMKPKTVMAVQKIKRVISVYLDWAIKHGYRTDRKNPLDSVDNKWYEKFANKAKALYFTDEQIHNYMAGCWNPQDRVLLLMLFEGVNGNNEYDEIRNLKKTDLKEDNWLKLTSDNGNVRDLQVSNELIQLIKDASEQSMYRKRNGHILITSKHASGLNEYTELVDNEFVIRNSDTRTTSYNVCVSPQLIYRRVKTIAETLHINHLGAKNIYYSGMVWWAKNLYKENGKLGREEYEVIAERFNLGDKWHHIKKVVNLNTIKELYGEV